MKYFVLGLLLLSVFGCDDANRPKLLVRHKGQIVTTCKEYRSVYSGLYAQDCEDGHIYSSSIYVVSNEGKFIQLIIPE